MGWDNANKGRESANYWLNFMANGKQARIDNRLYEKIADQDYRKANFQKAAFGKFIAPSTNGFATDGSEYDIGSYINLKFAANVGIGGKIGNTTVSQPGIIDYSLFRVSEAYLMKAEAQAQRGSESHAEHPDQCPHQRCSGLRQLSEHERYECTGYGKITNPYRNVG